MGYSNANMSIFLGPDIKSIRGLFSFYIEYSSKYEEKGKSSAQSDLTNVLSIRIQREFLKWKKDPWLLPDFLDCQRDAI